MEMKMYKAACYCRLSDDDAKDGTSVSIATQMAVAKEFCKENQFQIVDFYCDDGYTGTNFNRPEFKRMMSDVEKGKVNLVIVKDMSRFGREHIMVDTYTQVYFPENGIRFIAIHDNFDIKVSFKSSKIFKADESEWVVAENAHEPIVTQELWDSAHLRVNTRKRKCNSEQPENMFKGILMCMDCGATMRVFNPKNKSRFFVCSKSQCRVAGDFKCSTHNIKYDVLAENVLRDINMMIRLLKTDEEAFAAKVLGNIRMDTSSEERIVNELKDIDRQLDRQTKKYKKLYDDYYDGVIHDSKLFQEMTAECEEKRKYYLTVKDRLEQELESSKKVFEDSENFIGLLKKYDYISELTPEIINTLIEKITVGEKTYIELNKAVQKVKIYYKFVGLIDKCE